MIEKITLPRSVTDASTPVFTLDGEHLLFFSGLELWIVGTNGSDPHCLSCGLANMPTLSASEQEGFATEFPDRKRVFFGAANSVAVLQCTPSVIDCTQRRIVPIDLAGARPSNMLVAPGGADLLPALDEGGGASPKLSPDGDEVVISDVVTDAVEQMTIAKLVPGPTEYTLADPRVLNPQGATSLTDANTEAWSDSAGLYEFKTFADGGADGTYVQVGGDAGGVPAVWQVNFATGQRRRLTAFPDWDEDDAPSPNGESIVIESDRGMHRVDMLGGLLPVRGFIDAPVVAVTANYFVAGPVERQCDLQPWLLPAAGDDDAQLMGQPIQPYTGGDVHAANNVSGYPQWNPNGTAIALNTESYTTNRSAPYLLIAHLIARRPTKPLSIVDSYPGAWAPTPAQYHGSIGAVDHVVLHGLAAGAATVTYGNDLGVISGDDSVTYDNYSDNGRDFVSGTASVTNPNLLTGPVTYSSHLTLTGADSGYTAINLQFSGIEFPPVTVTGTAVTSYDGTTVSGIPHVPQACPAILPRQPHTALSARIIRRRDRRMIRAQVTASVFGAGLNEAETDTRPVVDATVSAPGHTAYTNANGIAILPLRPHQHSPAVITETAGETLLGARTALRIGPPRARGS